MQFGGWVVVHFSHLTLGSYEDTLHLTHICLVVLTLFLVDHSLTSQLTSDSGFLSPRQSLCIVRNYLARSHWA